MELTREELSALFEAARARELHALRAQNDVLRDMKKRLDDYFAAEQAQKDLSEERRKNRAPEDWAKSWAVELLAAEKEMREGKI